MMTLANPEHFSVTKIVRFGAAHKLPGYPGDCADLHGHTWKVEVEVALADNQSYNPDKDQMLLDFYDFKTIIHMAFLDKVDHKYLNDIEGLEYPSAENITLWIKRQLYNVFPAIVMLVRVRVWESEDSYAEWRRI
ncbi:MAG: 6-pyruvoyl trahydropterin synthase family protein [Candidatus Thorarchaeota archaeon]